MWLMTRHGFYSVVVPRDGKEPKDGSVLVVRARVRKDLENLRGFVPELGPVQESDRSDYRFRAFVDATAFAAGVAELARDIDYPNFKDEVKKRSRKHEAAYHRVWSILGDLQPGGPYGLRRRKKRGRKGGGGTTARHGSPLPGRAFDEFEALSRISDAEADAEEDALTEWLEGIDASPIDARFL